MRFKPHVAPLLALLLLIQPLFPGAHAARLPLLQRQLGGRGLTSPLDIDFPAAPNTSEEPILEPSPAVPAEVPGLVENARVLPSKPPSPSAQPSLQAGSQEASVARESPDLEPSAGVAEATAEVDPPADVVVVVAPKDKDGKQPASSEPEATPQPSDEASGGDAKGEDEVAANSVESPEVESATMTAFPGSAGNIADSFEGASPEPVAPQPSIEAVEGNGVEIKVSVENAAETPESESADMTDLSGSLGNVLKSSGEETFEPVALQASDGPVEVDNSGTNVEDEAAAEFRKSESSEASTLSGGLGKVLNAFEDESSESAEPHASDEAIAVDVLETELAGGDAVESPDVGSADVGGPSGTLGSVLDSLDEKNLGPKAPQVTDEAVESDTADVEDVTAVVIESPEPENTDVTGLSGALEKVLGSSNGEDTDLATTQPSDEAVESDAADAGDMTEGPTESPETDSADVMTLSGSLGEALEALEGESAESPDPQIEPSPASDIAEIIGAAVGNAPRQLLVDETEVASAEPTDESFDWASLTDAPLFTKGEGDVTGIGSHDGVPVPSPLVDEEEPTQSPENDEILDFNFSGMRPPPVAASLDNTDESIDELVPESSPEDTLQSSPEAGVNVRISLAGRSQSAEAFTTETDNAIREFIADETDSSPQDWKLVNLTDTIPAVQRQASSESEWYASYEATLPEDTAETEVWDLETSIGEGRLDTVLQEKTSSDSLTVRLAEDTVFTGGGSTGGASSTDVESESVEETENAANGAPQDDEDDESEDESGKGKERLPIILGSLFGLLALSLAALGALAFVRKQRRSPDHMIDGVPRAPSTITSIESSETGTSRYNTGAPVHPRGPQVLRNESRILDWQMENAENAEMAGHIQGREAGGAGGPFVASQNRSSEASHSRAETLSLGEVP